MRSVILCCSAELRRKDQKPDYSIVCLTDWTAMSLWEKPAVSVLTDYIFRKGQFHSEAHRP